MTLVHILQVLRINKLVSIYLAYSIKKCTPFRLTNFKLLKIN